MILTRSNHQAGPHLSVPPDWCADYVGIPFRSNGRDRSGCDCYGLLTLVSRERFGVTLPLYSGDYADAGESQEIAALIGNLLAASAWRSVETPSSGDAILLRIAGAPSHVGVIAAPALGHQALCGAAVGAVAPQLEADGSAAAWFLHVRPGTDSCLERYDSLRWRRRIVGFYRYAGQ